MINDSINNIFSSDRSALVRDEALAVAAGETSFALRDVVDVESLDALAFAGFVFYLAVSELAAFALVLADRALTDDVGLQDFFDRVDGLLAGLQV